MSYISKHILSIKVVVLVYLTACNNPVSISDYEWLNGQWQRVDIEEGQKAYETWELENDQLKGIGCTIEDNDTVFVEYLSIYKKGGKYYYSADVAHNPEAVAFEITPTPNGFICVNEGHDFPNKINYEKHRDSLIVFISDMSESKKRYFRFVRLN